MTSAYPLLDLMVRTPRLELRGATDELLEQLVPHVVAGVFDPDGPAPFDDPMSFYDNSPNREWRWLRAIWAGRARVDPDEWWRLYFAVVVDGQAVGMQDLTGINFRRLGTVATFSWLARTHQGVGIGTEMRAAILHLAFGAFDARRAQSEAFVDNVASNAISVGMGYEANGTEWATRLGVPARMIRYELTREKWLEGRRQDIQIFGVEPCRPVLGL